MRPGRSRANSLGLAARLKQHHMFQVASWYATGSYVLILVANAVFPDIGLTRDDVRYVIGALALGFPVALTLGWIFIPPSREDPKGFTRWKKMRWRLGTVVSILVTAFVIVSGTYLWRMNERHLGAYGPGAKSVAVLPFENLSGDPNNAYFTSGMQDMILTKLAGIGDLKVISRTSTEKYASHPDDLGSIGRALGVATVLEGSVQKSGDQVLINVQLIDAASGAHLWAEAYTRTLDNIFGVEGEVAQNIADKLDAKLVGGERRDIAKSPTQDPKAYDLYLRAEYIVNRATALTDARQLAGAIDLYRQAVSADPKFALAYARLAIAQEWLYWLGGAPGLPQRDVASEAHANAEQALALEPTLADANVAMGSYYYRVTGDYVQALKSLGLALSERPNDPYSLLVSALVLRRLGRWDEALRDVEAAATLDPENVVYAAALGDFYAANRRNAEAEQAYQRAMALDDRTVSSHYAQFIVASSGDVARALALVQGDDPNQQRYQALFLQYQRKDAAALALVQSLPETGSNAAEAPKELQIGWLLQRTGEEARARASFTVAEARLTRAIKAAPPGYIGLAHMQNNLAFAQVGLGDTQDGIASAGKALDTLPVSKDGADGLMVMGEAAGVYAQARRADLAVPLLENLFVLPGGGRAISAPQLALDPVWDPIRSDPRFQALLKRHPFDPNKT